MWMAANQAPDISILPPAFGSMAWAFGGAKELPGQVPSGISPERKQGLQERSKARKAAPAKKPAGTIQGSQVGNVPWPQAPEVGSGRYNL